MFYGASFNKNISNWNVNKVINEIMMFEECPIKDEYKPKFKKMYEGFSFDSVNKQNKSVNAYDVLRNNVKQIVQKILETDKLSVNDKELMLSLPPAIYQTENEEIKTLVRRCTYVFFGFNCDLNWIDTSKVTNMEFLFKDSEFNGDISMWDVSNVTNMDYMFIGSEFNGDISKWNVSNVTTMKAMFKKSNFNSDIS
jgi:surface protein